MKLLIDINRMYYEMIKFDVNDLHNDFIPYKIIANGTPLTEIKFTTQEWVNFLSEKFEISRTSARAMLHVMMKIKKEDNFKKANLTIESEE